MGNVQLGKQGVTPGFIESLRNYFKKHENVKVSALKSATRDRSELLKIAGEIAERLGRNYTAKTIGYTIVVKKWRKNVR
jgi:RNA-binding protein YhbY